MIYIEACWFCDGNGYLWVWRCRNTTTQVECPECKGTGRLLVLLNHAKG